MLENLNLAEQEVKDLEKAIRSLWVLSIEAFDTSTKKYTTVYFLNSLRDDIFCQRKICLEKPLQRWMMR